MKMVCYCFTKSPRPTNSLMKRQPIRNHNNQLTPYSLSFKGDGGSALVCGVNGQYYVAGIVAWGIGCADKGIPGVYVNIPSYVNWINQKISGT